MPKAKKTPHEKVMGFVERELKKNPGIKSKDLLAKAKKVSRSVSGLSVRQFHAKYPLQVRRRWAPKKPRKPQVRKAKAPRKAAAKAADGRDDVRAILLGFARDLSAADTPTATIDVMLGLDAYVDRVMKAAS